MNKKSAGFGVVEIVLIVAVVALLGFIGYRVWSAREDATVEQATPATTTQITDEAPQINNASDLNKAGEALDGTDVEGESASQLDAEMQY